MKKKMMNVLTGLMMVAALTLTISACGGDDTPVSNPPSGENGEGGGDGGNGGGGGTTSFQGAKRIFGNNLVKSYGREGYDRYTLTYDANGFVTKVHRDRYQSGTTNVERTEEWLFSYNGTTATIALYRNGAFYRNDMVTIGNNGFASKITYGDDVVDIEYDAAGHMTKQTWTDTDSKSSSSFNINWQNNDIITHTGDGSVTVGYTDATHSTPIENVSGAIELDRIMHIDMDDDISYVTGAIGFGPKHLPLSWSSSSGSSATIAWTLDAQNRAVKAVVNRTGYADPYVFYWEY